MTLQLLELGESAEKPDFWVSMQHRKIYQHHVAYSLVTRYSWSLVVLDPGMKR